MDFNTNLLFGSEFKAFLQKNKNNLICKDLLDDKLSNKKGTNTINFINIAIDDPSKIAFIPRNKIRPFITNLKQAIDVPGILFTNFGYKAVTITGKYTTLVKTINYDTFINHYFNTIVANGLTWHAETRQKSAVMSSPAKFINKLEHNYSEKEIDSFTRLFITLKGDKEFRVVSGDDLVKYYNEDYHYCNSGTLGNSCMRYDSCSEYFELYTDNNVELLCLFIGDKITGRALLWPEVYFEHLGEDKTFMDRVYVNNDLDTGLFKQYAVDKGYVYKEKQDYEYKDTFVFNNESFDESVEFKINGEYDYYPYVDTFTYLYDDALYNRYTEGEALESTDGTGGNVVYSEYEGCHIDRDDAIYSDVYESYIYDSNSIYINDSVFHIEDENICRCESCGEWFEYAERGSDDDVCSECCVFAEDTDGYIDASKALEFDGLWYEESTYSDYRGEQIPTCLAHWSNYEDSFVLEEDLEDIKEEEEAEEK